MQETKVPVEGKNDPYAAPGYARSRWAYIAECAFEYFIALLVADPFITRLLAYLEFDDATSGILQSLISVAFLFQLASIFVVQRITNVKKVAAVVHGVAQLLFMCIYLVPFMPFAKEYRMIIVIGCLLVGYFGNYLVTSIIFRWGNSYVDPNKRARYAATKEMISLLSGVIVLFAMSYIFGRFEESNAVETGFIFVAIVMTVVCAIDFTCLLLMKNRITEPPKKGDVVPFTQVLKILFTNKGFVYVVILTVLWQAAHYMTIGFMGSYKQSELGLTVYIVQIINIAGQMARFVISRPFGRYTDKRSYAKGITLGLSVAAVAFLINIFTTPETWWLVIVFTVLFNASMAGISQNLLNIIYNFVDEKYFVQASAIKNSIGGICGFLIALLGGALLDSVQASGNNVFGMTVYGQQILSAISFVILIIAILFTRCILEKQKTIAR